MWREIHYVVFYKTKQFLIMPTEALYTTSDFISCEIENVNVSSVQLDEHIDLSDDIIRLLA